ncbi:hypothetical protein [Noviherbaspirillum aridicola]|uniref:DUF2917 domain-containing protein n=1 Tax=Noviherbaspirillum aridicola TaxID=2849687 RepID=A0ABQ4Q4R2_9BURK|nr:hypothetical protein [Noviherbaspirillum aridicola]GIZ52186.1 hypothetical protein NCCP691_22000 [Noviherbaspirillum aridicola]
MPHPIQAVSLPGGQAFQIHAAAGARLVCLGGRAHVRPSPQWVAEHLLAPRLELGEGDELRIDGSGWLRIEAREPAELILIAPPPGALRLAASALAGAARRLLGGKRRTAGQAA